MGNIMQEYETILDYIKEKLQKTIDDIDISWRPWIESYGADSVYRTYDIYIGQLRIAEIYFCEDSSTALILSDASANITSATKLGLLGDPEFFKKLDQAINDIILEYKGQPCTNTKQS